jgi:AcrR family transcriptional regulator
MKKEPSRTETTRNKAKPPLGGSRQNLTLDTIIAVAVKEIRKTGIDSLSIRQLAVTLKVTPTALYHHLKDKEALLDLCAEHILAQTPVPDQRLPWQQRLRTLIMEQQRVFIQVPGLAKYLLVHRQSSVAALVWAEKVLQVMHEAGFAAPQTLRVLMSMSFLVNASTLDEHAPTKGFSPVLYRTQATALIKKQPGKFPCLSGVLPLLKDSSYETHFATALDRVIAGIESELAATAP